MRPSGDGRFPAVQTAFWQDYDWLVMTQSGQWQLGLGSCLFAYVREHFWMDDI